MSKKTEAAKTEETPKTLEEMILNFPKGKYSAIPLASLWAKELRKREENRHLTSSEILDLALKDVLSGSVDWKHLKKAAAESNGSDGEEKSKK
jgi:hypothetical protein